MKRTLLYSVLIYSQTAFVHCFHGSVVLKAKQLPSSSWCLPSCLCRQKQVLSAFLVPAEHSELSVSTVLFCPFLGCVLLFQLRVTGFTVIVSKSLGMQRSLKVSKCLNPWKNRQRTTRHDGCHAVKRYHLGSKELISGSVCVPCPFQPQAG